MPDVTPDASRRPEDADASMLRDRVTAAFGDIYLLGEEVGRGGMAVVYAATDVRLQRTVALKVLPPDLAFRSDVRERFTREAQTAARLNHPHIVPIYAVHEAQGMVCFAMALVQGESLAQRIVREPRPSFEFVATVLEQTADALAYAHACGVVHRDIKPDNILLDRDSGRVMVTDFGIARAAESGSRLTQTGIAVGTPAFMSPEQATGEREIDGRSDLYSVGVVGFLMLAGRLPFEASTTPAMLVKHVSETPPPIGALRPDAPRVLAEILERCLAKRPDHRWENALAMRDALRHAVRSGFRATVKTGSAAHAAPPQGVSRADAPAALPPGGHRAVPPGSAPRGAMTHGERGGERHGDRAGERRGIPRVGTGRHHDDWAPRPLASPELAQGPGTRGGLSRGHAPAAAMGNMGNVGNLPALPPIPALPPGASKREIREWERAVKDRRKEAKERWKLEREIARDQVDLHGGKTPEQRISRFRGKLLVSGTIVTFLTAVNASSGDFPWVIFPAFGLALGVISDYARLRERGIRLRHILGLSRLEAQVVIDSTPKPTRITRSVNALRRHLKWLGGGAAVAAGSFVIGSGLNYDPMLVPFFGGLGVGSLNAMLAARDWLRLRALGVSGADALGDGWKALAAASDDRPRDVRLRDETARVAGSAVLASRFGETVRSAVEDRVTIAETWERLAAADRDLVPDVAPTADALLERIGALASGLERLEADLPGDALPQLDARIVAAEAEPESSPDRERRLSLLQRQRASLSDLAQRRDTMQRQLESATLALRSLRLDMVKLRTLGVGAAIGDVTTATQEARALSLDIGRAVDVADELRKL